MINKKEFIQSYSEAIKNGKAEVFIGAGNSISSGFIDWKNLLKPLAEEIGLDIENEHDYLSLAQYYVNYRGNRSKLANHIIKTFSKEEFYNENADILSRLPIKNYWTTNYDHVLEEYIKRNNGNYYVCKKIDNITIEKDSTVKNIYKIHGDIDDPETIVLTKFDYLHYNFTHPLFLDMLKNSLLTKTFLFIGYSLNDPDIELILANIKHLLVDNVKDHYIILKKESDSYQRNKQNLFIDDLKKLGIQTLLLDDYAEIPEILRNIEKELMMRNIFISGSSCDAYSSWNKADMEELASELSYRLAGNGYKIISGFGLGIGSAVVNGILNYVYEKQDRKIDDSLSMHPFPQNINDQSERVKRFTEYRKSMIESTGIAIFMFGYKKDKDGNVINANGCIEEYKIAKENKNIIIPLAFTGYAAKEIYNDMFSNKDLYHYLDGYWDKLKERDSIKNIIQLVMDIIENSKNQLYI